jgi:hypothetical protein
MPEFYGEIGFADISCSGLSRYTYPSELARIPVNKDEKLNGKKAVLTRQIDHDIVTPR